VIWVEKERRRDGAKRRATAAKVVKSRAEERAERLRWMVKAGQNR